MKPQLRKALEIIAALPNEAIEATTPDLRELTDKLYDLGFLNIAPPGWRYRINDSGRAELAKLVPAPVTWRQRVRKHAMGVSLEGKKVRVVA